MFTRNIQVVIALFFFVNYLFAKNKFIESTKEIETIFREIGFSPACVSKTLSDCENTISQQASFNISSKLDKLIEIVNNLNLENKRPRNCHEIQKEGDTESGGRIIYPYSCCQNHPVHVYCDQKSDGGGWTVFQHRENLESREDFYRIWVQYQTGFGDLNGEFWLGLNNLYVLVKDTFMELRIDLEDYDGQKRLAKYEHFSIAGPEDNYRVSISKYSGTAGDSLSGVNGQAFSTHDKDNDIYPENCAEKFRGAWWYSKCHSSNLNGYQYQGNHSSYADGINWKDFRGHHYSLRVTSMMVRPKYT